MYMYTSQNFQRYGKISHIKSRHTHFRALSKVLDQRTDI